MGFRWLEVLEKEFDKAFVDLDLILGDIDEEQQDLSMEGRDRMTRWDDPTKGEITSNDARIKIYEIFTADR